MGRLTSSGSSDSLRRELFPAGFAGEVMLLILESWRHFSLRPRVQFEERITAVFRDALIAAYVAADRSWFIVMEDPITDPSFGTELGRNDLRFYPPKHYGQTIFFTVECKRLRVTYTSGFKHLADKYVEDGMQRFVDGKYSSGLPCGGMLGYVMDNQLDDALAQVQNEIAPRRSKLETTSTRPLESPSSVLPDYRWSADTVHKRIDGEFRLHHLLVGIPPNTSKSGS